MPRPIGWMGRGARRNLPCPPKEIAPRRLLSSPSPRRGGGRNRSKSLWRGTWHGARKGPAVRSPPNRTWRPLAFALLASLLALASRPVGAQPCPLESGTTASRTSSSWPALRTDRVAFGEAQIDSATDVADAISAPPKAAPGRRGSASRSRPSTTQSPPSERNGCATSAASAPRKNRAANRLGESRWCDRC